MTETKRRRFRFSFEVAVTTREQHGAFAHLYALERVETLQGSDRQLWLDVLAELDKLDKTERKDDEIPKL
jgi:hypothetical protein